MPKKILIDETELFDEEKQEFIKIPKTEVTLEHSLLSISKWESITHQPFLIDTPKKTQDQILLYIKCMVIGEDVDPNIFRGLKAKQINEIVDYIQDPCTATTINRRSNKRNRDVITSELIYYWMCANYIPFSCETWNINRLLTLIEVCSIKNDPKQGKMKTRDILSQNAALNKARRAKLGTTG